MPESAPPESAPPSAPRPSRGRGALLGVPALGIVLLGAYAYLARRAPVPLSPPPPLPTAPTAPAAPAPAPPPAAVVAASSMTAESAAPEHPENQEAELPPPPHLKPGEMGLYGVIYDLATKKPVVGSQLVLRWNGEYHTLWTDRHGWYRLIMPMRLTDITVELRARDYSPGALQEMDPPLASRSDIERHTIAETADQPLKPIIVPTNAAEPLMELDLVAIPNVWPASMSPAKFDDVQEPPVPEEPDERTCRIYGVVFDLATKKPMRHLKLDVTQTNASVSTDGFGRYHLDIPLMLLASELTVSGNAPDYRPGLMAERDPPMRLMAMKRRREIADTVDLSFDPVPLPGADCDDGLIRFDMAAVPARWPSR